jgi:ABC-type Fe3+-hydroxamate transport system substrate-binding protein
MKRKPLSLILPFLIILSLAGCDERSSSQPAPFPQRVVSLSLSIDEMLMDSIGPQRILALSSMADLSGLSNIADQASLIELRSKPELEHLLSLEGDLYLLPDWTDPSLVEGLQQFEKNHAIIPTPSSMEELLIQFHTLEELLGPDPGFSRLQSEITQRLQGLSDKLKERFGERIPTILEWTRTVASAVQRVSWASWCASLGPPSPNCRRSRTNGAGGLSTRKNSAWLTQIICFYQIGFGGTAGGQNSG